jgi:hypothetical protein
MDFFVCAKIIPKGSLVSKMCCYFLRICMRKFVLRVSICVCMCVCVCVHMHVKIRLVSESALNVSDSLQKTF